MPTAPTPLRFRLYLVEDHPGMRDSLTRLLEEQPDFAVCGMAASAEQALDEFATTPEVPPFDLALVDIMLPGINGIELVRRLKAQQPDVRCLMLSGHPPEQYERLAIRAGAVGYVSKGDTDHLIDTIRRVLPSNDGPTPSGGWGQTLDRTPLS